MRVAVSVVVRVAVAASDAKCDVSSGLLQPFVDLQRGGGADVLRAVPVVAQAVVHADSLGQSGIVGQRSGGELEWVVVPSGRFVAAFAMGSAETEFWSELDVPRRVGLPLYAILESEVAAVAVLRFSRVKFHFFIFRLSSFN